MGSSQRNIITGRIRHGFGQYFMGTSFPYMLASTVFRLAYPPIIIGSLASLWGYISSYFNNVKKFDDEATVKLIRTFQRNSLIYGKKKTTRMINDKQKTIWDPEKTGYEMPNRLD